MLMAQLDEIINHPASAVYIGRHLLERARNLHERSELTRRRALILLEVINEEFNRSGDPKSDILH